MGRGAAVARRLLPTAVVLLLTAAVVVAGLEIGLRLWPGLLGPAFVNGVRSRYSTRSGGIYYRDPALGIDFMIPDHRAEMFYNGYAWTHRTDALGFRNRAVTIPADVLLLGDSYIYGHGVDIEDTVAVQLEAMTGLRVANLARQGDCAFQEAYILTEYIGVYRPRYVVQFFYENDITDLPLFLDVSAMRAFVATPVDQIRYPPRTDPALAMRAREASLHTWLARLRDSSYVVKAGRWLLWRLGARPAQASPAGPPDPDDPDSLAWQYTRKAIVYMHWLSARHGAELIMAPITPHRPGQRAILAAIARAEGVAFLDTSAFTASDAALWLPGDGHFSPLGARRMAAVVAGYLVSRGAAPGPRVDADRAAGGASELAPTPR